jgi:predicted Na+-dependent transporter
LVTTEGAPLDSLPKSCRKCVSAVAFVFVVSYALRWRHNGDETQNILVGLALVASMPIAGSSTAWSQHASGDLTISLGLVLLSTLTSPLTTPLILHAINFAASLNIHRIYASWRAMERGCFWFSSS